MGETSAVVDSLGGGFGHSSSGMVVGGGCRRASPQQYIKWLDAIHTVCVKLDDLCQKLDNEFPHSMARWEEQNGGGEAGGILNARKLFVENEEELLRLNSTINDVGDNRSRKRDESQASDVSGGVHCSSASSPSSKRSRVETGASYPSKSNLINTKHEKNISSSNSSSNGCAVLPTEEEYEYLLELPEQDGPDLQNPDDLKCDVAGVYWDKRSWIASWYDGGKRYYKSFSAKTHGFYKSKFWAIKVRLSKVRGNTISGKNTQKKK